jgi:hypothetical protein
LIDFRLHLDCQGILLIFADWITWQLLSNSVTLQLFRSYDHVVKEHDRLFFKKRFALYNVAQLYPFSHLTTALKFSHIAAGPVFRPRGGGTRSSLARGSFFLWLLVLSQTLINRLFILAFKPVESFFLILLFFKFNSLIRTSYQIKIKPKSFWCYILCC